MSTSLPRKKLPIGIQSFAKIREEGCYYVDKTPFACRLVEEGSYYFLSRPRRPRKIRATHGDSGGRIR